MYSEDSEFFLKSKQLAENFLQTTLIVDDQAQFDVLLQSSNDQSPEILQGLKEPGRGSRSKSIFSVLRKSQVTSGVSPTLPMKESHVLDAQKVINSFAQKRIVCSVIKPSRDLDWQKTVVELASSADIVILDWELDRDNGEKTLDILKKILSVAIATPAQLKLLSIYTGEPGIAGVVNKIRKLITTQMKIGEDKIVETDDGFSLSYQSIMITIFSKPGTIGLPVEYDGRKIEFDGLADRVTTEFTKMTAGLVSNAAINSLALIRNNTQKILNRFSTNLDAPYLTHRALQMNPEDAEDFLTELVAEELRAILEEESIGNVANIEMIILWLLATKNAEFPFCLDETSLTFDDVIQFLSTGISNSEKISKNKLDRPHKLPLTRMFTPQTIEDDNLDERFSLLTISRTYYQKKKPRLTFGSIIHNEKN